MVRFKLILIAAAVIVLCLQFGVLTQAQRQCDENDGTFTLVEQILLFPISLLDSNKCARDLEDVTDTTYAGRQFGTLIEYVHDVLDVFSQTVVGIRSYVGATLHSLYQMEGWLLELRIPTYFSFIATLNPTEYISHYLTYIWHFDPAGSVVKVLTMYALSLLPTCIPITQQFAYILPPDIIGTTMSNVRILFIELLKNPNWALRVLTAFLLAISLPVSLYRKYRNNIRSEQLQLLKNVNEHHLMCEIFDNEKCNCGGKQHDTDKANDIELHYGMCESFDKLPCNCGGVVKVNDAYTEYVIGPAKDEAISEPNNATRLVINTETDVDTLFNAAQPVGICMDINDDSRDEFVSIVTTEEENYLECSKENIVSDSSSDNYPRNIYQDVEFDIVPQGEERLLDEQDDSESVEIANLVREHYQMCECFDALPCNCGGRSFCSSEEMESLNVEVTGVNQSNKSGQNTSTTVLKQKENKDTSLPPLNNEGRSVDSAYFDYEVFSISNLPENATDGINVKIDIRDGSDIELLDNAEDISESGIGDPVYNSSFREESHYVTANREVSFEDTLAGGDGLSAFSTLTRRSPFVEHGLEDLVSDESFVDAETSILDISSINNSLSFTAGDGIFEFAVMFIAQTAWRLVYNTWKKKFSSGNVYDLSTQETSPGLYLLRQKNKLKGYLTTSLYRNNSASVGDDGYHADQEQDESERSDFTGMNLENECGTIPCSDGNNNADGEPTENGSLSDESDQHIGDSLIAKQSDHTQQTGETNLAGESNGNENIEDFETISEKFSRFKTLLLKARLFNCNVWELCDDLSENLNNDRSRLLAWAWSGTETNEGLINK